MESNLKNQINNYISEQLENSLNQFIENIGLEPNLKKTIKQRIPNFKCFYEYQSDAITYHILKLITQQIDKKLEMINSCDNQCSWEERLISAPTIMVLNDLKRQLE
jgi:hypothetical protein